MRPEIILSLPLPPSSGLFLIFLIGLETPSLLQHATMPPCRFTIKQVLGGLITTFEPRLGKICKYPFLSLHRMDGHTDPSASLLNVAI